MKNNNKIRYHNLMTDSSDTEANSDMVTWSDMVFDTKPIGSTVHTSKLSDYLPLLILSSLNEMK